MLMGVTAYKGRGGSRGTCCDGGEVGLQVGM